MNNTNSKIRKLVLDGLYNQSLYLYRTLLASGFHPNSFTFPSLLKASAKLQSPPQAHATHAHLLKTGFHADIYAATALIDTYMKLRLLDDALKVFDKTPNRNLASFNAVISGFSQNGCFREAMEVFKRVERGGFCPNSVTLASVLPSCEIAKQGAELHGFAVKLGHEMDVYVATALLTMYSNCKELDTALRAFGMIQEKKAVSYNAMISGLLTNGYSDMALNIFKEMIVSCGEKPNSVTWASLLSACSDLSALRLGMQIHNFVLKNEVGFDVLIGTALVDMYSKCGCLKWASQIFLGLNERDLITWNSMISGMLLHGHFETAFELFHQLESEGLEPDMATWNLMISGFSQRGNGVDAFRLFDKMRSAGVANPNLKTITSLLTACSTLSDLHHGREIHGHLVRTGADNDEFVSTALIDMYMKCGYSCQARWIFDRAVRRSDDLALWNAMISGYGRNGENESALEIFNQMQDERIQPNSATFISVLSVCGHTGQTEKGQELFKMMRREYGVHPTAKHFACMVDLLGRAGKLKEARVLIEEIPKPTASVFASLLGACKCHSDAELGEEMAERLWELDPGNPTPFVILSNIYAEQQRWVDVERVREMMKDRGLQKVPGYSWIGVRQESLHQHTQGF
ncbi:pentatricopeptide repeat-containing protein At2g02750 [Magnolia sinica]|uniref:pentatricopeptide repeat-containing protein At2g02750 n=1 Tax=Magnolia sinica TaxID=86752 RepID=UPI00265AB130|nr:pentatricopeptide repeat-containing protein At2g02750 [Magnolia sinica]